MLQMLSKKEAEKIETQLLETFDYAWNMGGNGVRRREDILRRLDKLVPYNSHVSKVLGLLHNLKSLAFGKNKVGIKINGSVPSGQASKHNLSSLNDPLNKLIPSVFKFNRARPQLVLERSVLNKDSPVCGVAMGDGSVCTNEAMDGRKRCSKHKGMKINGATNKFVVVDDIEANICGNTLRDGFLCTVPSIHGQRRCQVHGGHLNGDDDYNICGVILIDGSVCRSRPLRGRKRCCEHKGKRITGSRLISTKTKETILKESKSVICGVGLEDGSVWKKLPVHGRKRCQVHKGRRAASVVCSPKIGQPQGSLESQLNA